MFPLYLFTPWIEDALEAANPDTLKYCNVRVSREMERRLHIDCRTCAAVIGWVLLRRHQRDWGWCGRAGS